MPKVVRLNDKIWFGKYKNQRIKYILDRDVKYIDSLIDKNKIGLDTKTYLYYDMVKEEIQRERESGQNWDEFNDDL